MMSNSDIESAKLEIDSSSSSPPTRCCTRLRDDFRLSFFGVKAANGKVVDIPESFSAKPFWKTFLAKTLLLGWSIATLAQSISQTDEGRSFYMAYLTHWSLVTAIAYLLCSWILTTTRRLEQPPETERPNFFVRFTWGLFTCAGVMEMTATLLFWVLDYDPKYGPPSYVTVMAHGVVMLIVLVEGFAVNRVPVRAKHLLFVMIASVIYLLWSLIHSQTNIGNPQRSDGDPETDDDAIYSSVNWNQRPGSAAIVAVLSVFVVVPLLFLVFWSLSMWSCWFRFDGNNRKYYEHVSEAIDLKEGKMPTDEGVTNIAD